MTNPLRGPDKPYDPFVGKLGQEEKYGTRHPSRLETRNATLGNTTPQQRLRARVHGNTATQSINSGVTNTIVVFDTVTKTFPVPNEFDTSDGTNTAGLLNSNGFLIPSTGKITGTWLFHVHLNWAAAAAGYREVNIIVNSVANILASTHTLGSNDEQSQDVLVLVNDPPAGTFYKVAVNQTSGAGLNIDKDPAHTYFECIHLW